MVSSFVDPTQLRVGQTTKEISMAKANRLNMCSAVREALVKAGYSTVKVVNAVNGELEAMALEKSEEKTGDSKYSTKTGLVTVGTSVKETYKDKATIGRLFDVWNTHIKKAEECFTTVVEIPAIVKPWLDGFAKATAKETAQEAK
jgi:hypothetical protein